MSVLSSFIRLPAVPDDRERRKRLLENQQTQVRTIIETMPNVARLVAASERAESVDRYAEGIQAAYGKL